MLKRELSFLTLLVLLCQHGVNAVDLITCEKETAKPTCAKGTIKVLSANYGRTDKAACSIGKPANQLLNVQCRQTTSLTVVAKECDGKQDCSISASNRVFGDPCVGTCKYLNVSYTCSQEKTVIICQDESSTIGCEGRRRLNIHFANYGRRDKVTCPGHRPGHHPEAMSTTCISSETRTLQNKCNGKKRCQLLASNANFTNQCPRVPKYLEVTYTCE